MTEPATLTVTRARDRARSVPLGPEHPAVVAWMRTSSASSVPTGAISFGRRRGSKPIRALLLQDAFPDGSGVIAKLTSAATCAHERRIYEQVLPALGVARLACHGAVPDQTSARWWLFLEDAGGRPYEPASDLGLKLEWLAATHRAGARLAILAALPDRGLDFERRRLIAGLAGLRGAAHAGTLSATQAAGVRAAARCLERLLAGWHALAARCARLPRVLVHGDLADKNARVRGDKFLAFDWEMAGEGPPLLDLAELADPARRDERLRYSDAVRTAHPVMEPDVVLECARLGALLRNAAAIAWESLSLCSPEPSHSVYLIEHYRENVDAWLRTAYG